MSSGCSSTDELYPTPSCPVCNNAAAGDFECNICLELAQDPIVTLCGHLFCWPCLYNWLHHHSNSLECPVCKAIVQGDNNLVPLYGRGRNQTDPRRNSYLGIEIPRRPTGQRPATDPLALYDDDVFGSLRVFPSSIDYQTFMDFLMNYETNLGLSGFQDDRDHELSPFQGQQFIGVVVFKTLLRQLNKDIDNEPQIH
ncbi:hypothetical protein ACFE04_002090 [Oxalis oulophora]